MKQLLTLLFVAISAATFAQAPQGINYQAVIRDNGGAVLANQAVGMKVAILQGSPSGTAVYEESFSPTTSQFGLVNVVIGQGTIISGDFTTINWSAGPYYAEVSADETGGTNYAVLGTQQLMSVPYSLYAETAENVTNDQVDDADADPNNEIQDISLTGTDLTISGGSTVDLSVIQDGVNDADADPNNEIQAISFSNDTLYLSNGGQVYLGAYGVDLVDDADADPTNELQNWSNLPGIPAEITDGDDVDDADADPNNEIQAISFSNDTLYLSNGGQVYLGAYGVDNVVDADADPTNELQNWSNLPGIPAEITDGDDVDDADADPNNEIQAISFSNDTLYLSNGGQVYLGAYGVDLVNDADADPTNELQNWSNLPGIPAEITDGDDVDDADADPNNEYQVLALSNDTLYLSDGNSVYLGNLSFSIQNHGVRVGFSSSTIWTCPNNVYQVVVELWGGGGGGGGAWTAYGACSSSDGGDGGNGGYIMDTVSVTPGMSYSVVVGNGGNGGTWGGGAVYSGQPGEASSFGGVLSAPGGGAGTAGECVGTHGADGSIVDYNYQPLGNRSYIPSGFVQIIPGSFSPGGVGGYVYSGGGSAGQSGQNGEAGFVVISY